MRRLQLLAVVVIASLFACNTDSTDLLAPPRPSGPMAAVGIDPASGATIETNQDDYLPGELVRVTGHGWAANETVHFDMTEDPDTHGDVTADVQADSAGAFDVPFYDVQDHDLGVTFTLTATGLTSGSKATAVFTDGDVKAKTASLNSSNVTITVPWRQFSNTTCTSSPTATGSVTGISTASTSIRTIVAGQSVEMTAPATAGGQNFVSWTTGTTTLTTVTICVVGAQSAQNWVANYQAPPANTAPTLNSIGAKSVNEGSTLSFTATATDGDTPGQTLTFSLVGAPAGASIDPNTGAFSWTPADGPGGATFIVRVTDNGSPALSDDESITVTVNNVAPSAGFANDGPVDEGSAFTLSLSSAFDPSSVDLLTLQYAFDCGDGSGYGSFSNASTTSCSTTDNGTHPVRGKVQDKDGGLAEYTASVIVNNVPPTVTAVTAPFSIDEGQTINFSATGVTDPSSADVGAGFTYAFSCDEGTTWTAYGSNAGSCAAQDGPGTVHVAARAKDKDGGESAAVSHDVTVNNVPPTVTGITAPSSVDEGRTINFSATGVTDPSSADVSAGFTYAVSCDGGATWSTYGNNAGTCAALDGPGTVTVAAKAKDKDGGESAVVTQNVTVNNVPPTITSVTANPTVSGNVYPISQAVTIRALFTDPGTIDTHTCVATAVVLGLPTVTGSTGTGSSSSGMCSSVLGFASAGVYDVTLTATDKDGGSDSETLQIVIYDPSAGFVTGGGWIDSPVGAYPANPSLAGKATFGFVSKYKKGATIPDGNTQFVFHAAGFTFSSSLYQWLVVNQNGTNAQFKGTGTVNGSGDYTFMLWASDGSLDQFRIKIWDTVSGTVVYDNLLGSADGQVQPIAGGSIVVHAK